MQRGVGALCDTHRVWGNAAHKLDRGAKALWREYTDAPPTQSVWSELVLVTRA